MGLYFSISALLILLIFAITFFMKQRVKNSETEIYKYLLLITMFGLTLEISTAIMYNVGVDINNIFYQILSKMVFCYYLVWSYFFAKYIITVSNPKSKTKNFILILTILSSILVMISPISYIERGNVIMPDGVSLYITYLISIVYIFIDLYYCIRYRKKIVGMKFAPLYIFFALAIFSFIIQVIFPDLFLLGYIFSYDIMVMYFTIENPDVKMNRELEYAKTQAEKANRAKTDFLSSMSHEIRTPLNAVVGFSECIKTAKDLEEAKENADDIIMASQNLLEIVNGILDISKIEAEKMEIVEVEYMPNKIFNDLIKMTETRIGEKNIKLNAEFAEDIPEVLCGDRGKVQQIITNVLTNAVKYTEKGYIDFNVSCINKNDNCRLCIVVKDTGRGIKPEKIKTLFNKFERLEEDKNTTIEGTGLGLAITKSLAEMMGGKVVVQSDYGVGSTFTVYIPQKIVHNSVFKAVEEKEETVITYSNSKVLVVDDNSLNLKVANKVLGNFDLKVELIDNGFECINKIENKEHYDIIFMDIMMPKMGGLETLKKLKQFENFNIPVIALTADAMEGKSNKYIEAGFNGYLSKPINKDELKKILDKHLSEKKVKQVEEEIPQNKEDSRCLKRGLLIDTYEQTNEVVNFSKKLDIEVDSVENYEEFMNMYRKNNYDIIFVDCTDAEKYPKNLIEDLKKDKNFNIPVIALNDDKIMGLREYYRNLGYDGYLAHPISELVFKKIVLKLLKNKQPEEEVLSKKGNIEYLKTNGIDVDASIELLGDIEMYNETLRIFMEENKTRIPNLKQYKESGDMENYAIQVHALKSDSKYLGFKELAEYSYQHEMKSKEGNKDYVNDHFDELMSEYNRIYYIIKEY
ncbi:MAG: response regulator [Bacilli bacterium]|nr:response regulator [Bacilli bacterium]